MGVPSFLPPVRPSTICARRVRRGCGWVCIVDAEVSRFSFARSSHRIVPFVQAAPAQQAGATVVIVQTPGTQVMVG